MSEPLALRSYADWKHCITVLCGIPLTPGYVRTRVTALADPGDYTTRRFVEVWGAAHLERVHEWFEQARRELEESETEENGQ